MMNRDEKIPAYYRILVTLKSRIRDEVYDNDGKLPSTKKMAEEFGVSDITIKKALASLIEDGVLESRRGIGTRIQRKNTHKMKMPITSSNFWDWYSYRDLGVKQDIEVLSITQVPCNRLIKVKMGANNKGQLYQVKRIIKLMGVKASYFVTYFFDTFLDPKFLVDLEHQRFLKVASDHWKQEIVTVKQEIKVTIADLDLSGVLMINFGDPLFYVENIYYGADNSVLALTQMYHRGDVYSYTGTTHFVKDIIK
jgi:GntR family transcriptional regulator